MTNLSFMPQVRKPNFQWQSVDVHWCDNNPFLTHFINSMHVVFPEGEKYFIRSVKAFNDKIQNRQLQEKIKAFIGQESQHMVQHKKFWQVLEKQSTGFEKFYKVYMDMAYYNKDESKWSEKRRKFALAITVALEHYTAILAEIALENHEGLLDNMPDDMKYLLQWHAAEEIEHKSIAFDVLKEVDDDYLLRIGGMVLATWNLFFFILLGQVFFLSQDKAIQLFDLPKQFMGFINKTAPIFSTIANNVFDYFRPNFHPDQNDNYQLAEDFFAEFARYQKAV